MAAPEGNQFAAGNEGGRPTKYKDEYAQQAYKLCLLGATDAVMADFFDVTETTINNWKEQYQEFFESIRRAKLIADMEIANKLYDKAIGAEWIEQQAIKIKTGQYTEQVEIVDVRRAAPPDFQAISFWLRNRQPATWRDKQEHVLTGEDGQPIKSEVTHRITPEDVEAFKTFFNGKY